MVYLWELWVVASLTGFVVLIEVFAKMKCGNVGKVWCNGLVENRMWWKYGLDREGILYVSYGESSQNFLLMISTVITSVILRLHVRITGYLYGIWPVKEIMNWWVICQGNLQLALLGSFIRLKLRCVVVPNDAPTWHRPRRVLTSLATYPRKWFTCSLWYFV